MSEGDLEQQATPPGPHAAEPSALQPAEAAGPTSKDVSHDEDDAAAATERADSADEDAAAADDDDGGPPFDPPFAWPAPPFSWYQDALLLVLLGGAMGAFAYGYLKAITQVTDLWMGADGTGYPAPASFGFGGGRAWWIGLCAGTGLAVGVAKAALRLDTAPTFIDELRTMHTHPALSLKVASVALLGLMGGMPMG